MTRASRLFWLIGFFVGSSLCLYWHLHNTGRIGPQDLDANIILENVTYLLWPSSLMLITLTGKERLWSSIILESISVIANGFIYMGIGNLFVALYRKVIAENSSRQS
jgi:hypothetical protein